MTIIRHRNPFPAIWATVTAWNAENRRLAGLPAEERRAAMTARTEAARRDRMARKERRRGRYRRSLTGMLRGMRDRAAGNLWGMLRHGTWIRVGLCFGVLQFFADPHATGLFAIGVLLHFLFHTELADDGLSETRLARSERRVMALTAVVAAMILAGTTPLARSIVTEVFLPVAGGALAPVSFSRPVKEASGAATSGANVSGTPASGRWLKEMSVTMLDVTLFVALLLGVYGTTDKKFAAGIRNTSRPLCEPLVWRMDSLDTPALLSALDRNGNLGPCLVDDMSLEGITPLHMAVALGGNPHHIRTLGERGADINARRRGGVTPLHEAAARGTDPDPFMAMLLDLGADPTVRNDEGRTAADIATGNDAVSKAMTDRFHEAEETWRARADRAGPSATAGNPEGNGYGQ